jgi:O-antigen ligase
VWKWTLGFAMDHPLGGGFQSHFVDQITLPSGTTVNGVAFHNAFIEVLGEHGWVGLALFVGALAFAIRNLWRARRDSARAEELAWCYDLSGALLVSLMVLAGCSNFIGVAFQPMFWYLFATSTCLREYVRRYIVKQPVSIAGSEPIIVPTRTPNRVEHNPIGAPRPLL